MAKYGCLSFTHSVSLSHTHTDTHTHTHTYIHSVFCLHWHQLIRAELALARRSHAFQNKSTNRYFKRRIKSQAGWRRGHASSWTLSEIKSCEITVTSFVTCCPLRRLCPSVLPYSCVITRGGNPEVEAHARHQLTRKQLDVHIQAGAQHVVHVL